jgi:hypothetical protein
MVLVIRARSTLNISSSQAGLLDGNIVTAPHDFVEKSGTEFRSLTVLRDRAYVRDGQNAVRP